MTKRSGRSGSTRTICGPSQLPRIAPQESAITDGQCTGAKKT